MTFAALALAVLQEEGDPLDPHARIYERAAPAVCAASWNRSDWASGIVITPQGHVLSSAQAARSRDRELWVRFQDGVDRRARILFRHETREWLLAKLPDGTYPCLPLVDSRDVRSGDVVYVLGDSFGSLVTDAQPAISVGVITGRWWLEEIVQWGRYTGPVLEVSAAVNPYQAGGPCLNRRGEVIGVATLNFQSGRMAGAVIPSERFLDGVLSWIEDRDRGGGATLGCRFADDAGAVRLGRISTGGPAAGGGLSIGMRVLEIERARTYFAPADAEHARRLLFCLEPDEEVALTVERDGRPERVVLKAAPEEIY